MASNRVAKKAMVRKRVVLIEIGKVSFNPCERGDAYFTSGISYSTLPGLTPGKAKYGLYRLLLESVTDEEYKKYIENSKRVKIAIVRKSKRRK